MSNPPSIRKVFANSVESVEKVADLFSKSCRAEFGGDRWQSEREVGREGRPNANAQKPKHANWWINPILPDYLLQ